MDRKTESNDRIWGKAWKTNSVPLVQKTPHWLTNCDNSFNCQSEPIDGRIAASCLTDPEWWSVSLTYLVTSD